MGIKEYVERKQKQFLEDHSDGIGYIVYIFEINDEGMGTGFNSTNCDMGDAMVAIKRIAEWFGVDLRRLAEVIE